MEEKQKSIPAYSIHDIAQWQTELQNQSNSNTQNKIVLPSLQRGFVWRPHQIESLWDSILRGYPIGSVLMSESGKSKELLDGQQRSTSIALGYYDPIDDLGFDFLSFTKDQDKTFAAKSIIPLVWIDLKPLENNKNGLKYGLRVLTKSHPWGYQLNDHTKPLSSHERGKALTYYKAKYERRCKDKELNSFTDIPNEMKSPWDAHYPVPLFLLLGRHKEEGLKEIIINYCDTHLNDIQTRYSSESGVNYRELNSEDWQEIQKAAKRAKNLLIPEILVNNEDLFEEEKIENENTSTLFIRLNSEGTRISGEELIYSLFKATFPELKEAVENIGLEFIKPSKIINLLSRLILTESNNYSFQSDINLKRFRSELASTEGEFEKTLSKFITGNADIISAKELFGKAVDQVITFNNEIPKIFYKDSISSSLDLLYVLLVYLKEGKKPNNEEYAFIHRSFTYISKFKIDDRKVANKIFHALKMQEDPFSDWKKAINLVTEEHPDLLPPLMSPENFDKFLIEILLKDYLNSQITWFNNEDYLRRLVKENRAKLDFLFKYPNKSSTVNIDELEFEKLSAAVEYWLNVANRIYWNKSFLIVSQSSYFKREFKDFIQFESIVDTNKPWDWDHIYPLSWVYNKKGISQKVRNIINLNGNFRALSFNDNRKENNHESPKKRFKNKKEVQCDSFVKENDLHYWLNLDQESRGIKPNDKLKEANFIQAVFYRISNIYREFYKNFNID